MNTTLRRRDMLRCCLTIPLTSGAARALSAAELSPPAVEKALLGPWFIAVGQVSIIISLDPAGQALVVFDENGATTIGRHVWRPLPGGVLIDTLPRFRMWHMPHASDACEARVQMETLPDEVELSSGIRNLPRRFCMKRVSHAPLPRALAERPLPAGWDAEKPVE